MLEERINMDDYNFQDEVEKAEGGDEKQDQFTEPLHCDQCGMKHDGSLGNLCGICIINKRLGITHEVKIRI